MDKSWINIKQRLDPLFQKGAEEFVKFACENKPSVTKFLCPCKKCRNLKYAHKDDIAEHIIVDGFLQSYTRWIFHGERYSSSTTANESVVGDAMHDMLYDDGVPPPSIVHEVVDGEAHQHTEGPDEHTNEFFKLVKEAERELYPGCTTFSTLSFIVHLLHIKCIGGLSDRSITMLLKLLKEALPEGETLPISFSEATKVIAELGLDYKKINGCPSTLAEFKADLVAKLQAMGYPTPQQDGPSDPLGTKQVLDASSTHQVRSPMLHSIEQQNLQLEAQRKQAMGYSIPQQDEPSDPLGTKQNPDAFSTHQVISPMLHSIEQQNLQAEAQAKQLDLRKSSSSQHIMSNEMPPLKKGKKQVEDTNHMVVEEL